MNLKVKQAADYYIGGTIHVVLKPFVFILGKVLRRNHALDDVRDITIVKMLGGGSLVIAYPSLVALKERIPTLKLRLVTTPSIKPFAELLGIFDEVLVVRDDSLLGMALDSIRVIIRLWRAHVLVDFEIHSRFSSVFSLLTAAVNRIGIYTDLSFWRRSIYTHLIFYNKYSPIHGLYDQVVRLFGVTESDYAAAQAQFRLMLRATPSEGLPTKAHSGVAPGCSDLSRERMLSAGQWAGILQKRLPVNQRPTLHFVGGPSDRALADEIIRELQATEPDWICRNHCGECTLRESIELLNQMDALYCVDSSLLHFARLLGIKTVSFWGPTDPRIMLRPDPALQEEANYVKLGCSPCIHIAFEPPCFGNNLCMAASAYGDSYQGDRNPIWAVQPLKKRSVPQ